MSTFFFFFSSKSVFKYLGIFSYLCYTETQERSLKDVRGSQRINECYNSDPRDQPWGKRIPTETVIILDQSFNFSAHAPSPGSVKGTLSPVIAEGVWALLPPSKGTPDPVSKMWTRCHSQFIRDKGVFSARVPSEPCCGVVTVLVLFKGTSLLRVSAQFAFSPEAAMEILKIVL